MPFRKEELHIETSVVWYIWCMQVINTHCLYKALTLLILAMSKIATLNQPHKIFTLSLTQRTILDTGNGSVWSLTLHLAIPATLRCHNDTLIVSLFNISNEVQFRGYISTKKASQTCYIKEHLRPSKIKEIRWNHASWLVLASPLCLVTFKTDNFHLCSFRPRPGNADVTVMI